MVEELGGTRRGRKPGSRPGQSASRKAILDAAITVFSEKGYDSGSVRAIAAKAGVDPALVRHFFGDKANLLVEAVATRTSVGSRIGEMYGGLGGTSDGEHLVSAYFAIWEDEETRPALIALMRAVAGSPEAMTRLRGFILDALLPHALAAGLPERKVGLAMGQLFGVAAARYIAELPQLTSLSREEIVKMLAPAVQAVLDAE